MKSNPLIDFDDDRTRKLADDLVNGVYKSAILHGEIDPIGKTKEEIKIEFLEYLEKNYVEKTGDNEWHAVIDYKEDILKNARKFKNTDPYFAILLYSTWVEHLINEILYYKLIGSGFTPKETSQIIRETNINSKTGWLLRLLYCKKLNEKHLAVIKKMIEYRNGFVHYKYKTKPLDEAIHGKEILDVLLSFEKTVRYLKNYSHKELYRGAPRNIVKSSI